jgi:hypothetical protein
MYGEDGREKGEDGREKGEENEKYVNSDVNGSCS